MPGVLTSPPIRAPRRPVVGRAFGKVIVTLHGVLDGEAIEHFLQVVGGLLDDQANRHVIVDCRDVSVIARMLSRGGRLEIHRGYREPRLTA